MLEPLQLPKKMVLVILIKEKLSKATIFNFMLLLTMQNIEKLQFLCFKIKYPNRFMGFFLC